VATISAKRPCISDTKILTWEAPKGNWQVIVQGKNLFNRHYYFGQFDVVLAGGAAQIRNPAPPLDIALEIRHSM
jgi:outer membrane receptor protein involved in Fe transport